MGDRGRVVALESVFGPDWASTRFRGRDGGWIGLAAELLAPAIGVGWLVLEGTFYEGADQIVGVTASDDRGGRIDVASDVNVEGAPGSWRLALRSGDQTARPVKLELPYLVDPARGLFCTGARWVPERTGQVQIRWLGDGASASVDLRRERQGAAALATPGRRIRHIDVAALRGTGLRTVTTYRGQPERWTAPAFAISLDPGHSGWGAVRLSGRNCLGYQQIFDARITVDGEAVSFFCHIKQEDDGLNWSIDLVAYSTGDRIELRCVLPGADNDIDDEELGVCLGGVTVTPGSIPAENGAALAFANVFAVPARRGGAGATPGFGDAPVCGGHLLVPNSSNARVLEIEIAGAGADDYVLAFQAGETLVESGREATSDGARFRFALMDGRQDREGWSVVTVRRFSSSNLDTQIVDVTLT